MYIFFLKLKKKFFSFFKIFSLLFSFKFPYYSPITPQLSFSYIFKIFFNWGKKFVFLFFVFLFLLSFFLFSFLF